MKKVSLLIGLLSIFLAGCGDDKTQNQQIKELQTKVLDMEAQMKHAEAEMATLLEEHQKMSREFLVLKASIATNPGKGEIPREQTLHPSREEMRSEAHRRSQLKREQLVIERAKRAIGAMLSQVSLDELVNRLNRGNILHPDGASWTRPRLETFMKEHRIERQTQK